jgi:hypothetical protein
MGTNAVPVLDECTFCVLLVSKVRYVREKYVLHGPLIFSIHHQLFSVGMSNLLQMIQGLYFGYI